MKKFIINLLLILIISIPTSAFGTVRTFPSGSFIIPMDSTYQPSTNNGVADGGIFEAYGLVYQLLENGVTVYWIIDETKTTISSPDLTINSTQANPVVNEYDHNNGTTAIANITTSISYIGAPFVIDLNDSALTQTVINLTFNHADWSAVSIHKTAVPFSGNVAREMLGTPPKIALMNSEENKTKGNAAILESYLRLAGICSTNYDIVTPLEIRDNILETPTPYDLLWAPHWTGYKTYANDVEAIITKVGEFLNRGGGLFAECASIEVFEHSQNGKFLTDNEFGHNGGTQDPAKMIYDNPVEPYNQIGDFTYTPVGGHLHNWREYRVGDPVNIPPAPGAASTYNSTVKRFTYDDVDGDITTTEDQWDYYVGGRYKGDANKGYVLYLGGHKYAQCNTGTSQSSTPGTHTVQFEFDKTIAPIAEFEFKENIVNGETFSFTFNYSGGSVSSLTLTSISKNSHAVVQQNADIKIDFTNADFNNEKIKKVSFENLAGATLTITSIKVSWNGHNTQKLKKIKANGSDVFTNNNGVNSGSTNSTSGFSIAATEAVFAFTINYNNNSSLTVSSVKASSHGVSNQNSEFKVDFTNAVFNDKKIENVSFTNLSSQVITIDSVVVSWSGGVSNQKIKKIKDFDQEVFNDGNGLSSPATCSTSNFSIPPVSNSTVSTTSCTNNSDCTWTNVAGVRYVLNTLFNLQFDVVDVKFAKATAIVHDDLMYKGDYKYPSFKGGLAAYPVETTSTNPVWDAQTNIPNADGRTIYTVLDTDAAVDGIIKTSPSLIAFNIANLTTNSQTNTLFQSAFDLGIPYTGNETTYQDLLNKIRGKDSSGADLQNKLGGIIHSSPVIVGPYSRSNANRPTMAYFGTAYGVLHAFKVPANKAELDANLPSDYKELWGFIPYSQLGSLKNDRTDNPPTSPFPGIDASPVVSEAYIDHDNNPNTAKQWRTILISLNGIYGKHSSLFALDITEPDPSVAGGGPSLLWETRGQDYPVSPTDNTTPTTITMGSGYRITISKVDVSGVQKYYVFISTNYKKIGGTEKGLRIFAFDLETGAQKWVFEVPYSSQNDAPGALTAIDTTGDSNIDKVIVGDMDGRVWMLEAIDGTNPFGTDNTIVKGSQNLIYRAINFLFRITPAYAAVNQIPLFNGGSGADIVNAGIGYPISGSISVGQSGNGSTLIYFGTGGADWANLTSSQRNNIIAVDITTVRSDKSYKNGAGTVVWNYELEAGEKVWGAVTVSGNNVYAGTNFGTVESADPNDDMCAQGSSCGNIISINKETGAQNWKLAVNAKIRSSVFVKKGHLYAATNNGQVTQIGNGTFAQERNIKPLSWREK